MKQVKDNLEFQDIQFDGMASSSPAKETTGKSTKLAPLVVEHIFSNLDQFWEPKFKNSKTKSKEVTVPNTGADVSSLETTPTNAAKQMPRRSMVTPTKIRLSAADKVLRADHFECDESTVREPSPTPVPAKHAIRTSQSSNLEEENEGHQEYEAANDASNPSDNRKPPSKQNHSRGASKQKRQLPTLPTLDVNESDNDISGKENDLGVELPDCPESPPSKKRRDKRAPSPLPFVESPAERTRSKKPIADIPQELLPGHKSSGRAEKQPKSGAKKKGSSKKRKRDGPIDGNLE